MNQHGNHQAIDPSLCTGEPLLESLDDGFSPPADARGQQAQQSGHAEPADPMLGTQSPF